MLFQNETEKAVTLSLNRAKLIGGGIYSAEARRAIEYHESVIYQEEDLTTRLGALYANKAKWEARPKACYNLTAAITGALCTLWSDPVSYDFQGDGQAEALWAEIDGWASLMSDVDRYTLLGGLLGVRPIIVDGKVEFALYPQDQVEYVQTPDDVTKAQQIVLSWFTGQAYSRSRVSHFWTAEQYAQTVNDVLVGTVEDNPYKQIPVEFFRNDFGRWDFFGRPASDLSAANMALNSMLTDLNHTVRWQAHGQLVLIGAPPDYKPPIGADTYLSVSNAPNSTGADARYINPNADIGSIINAINQNLEMVFSARRIPKAAVVAVQGDSGVSLVAQQEALRDWRKRRIAVMRPQEERLIALTLKVAHYHATGELRDFEPPQITYTELRPPMADDARLDWDWKLRLGIVSPVDVMLALNPGMPREEAEEKLAENRAMQRERFTDMMRSRIPAEAPAVPAEAQEDEDEDR